MSPAVNVSEKSSKKDAERINRSVKLVKPKGPDLDRCKYDVETALIDLEFHKGQLHAVNLHKTAKGKKAARQLAIAIRRFEKALRNPDLSFYLAHGLPAFPSDTQYCPRAASPSPKERPKQQRCVNKSLLALEWGKFASHCIDIADEPPAKLKRYAAEAKRQAVAAARELLLTYRPEALVATTARSDFCLLARELYGDKKENLHSNCREALRKKRGAK
jgi:hypothetical protein